MSPSDFENTPTIVIPLLFGAEDVSFNTPTDLDSPFGDAPTSGVAPES